MRDYIKSLKNLPNELITEEMCKKAVEQGGYALNYVPEGFKTEEICRIAVRQNGWLLEYVPEKFKTEELCKLAVEQDGTALHYVPEELKTKELYLLAMREDPYVLDIIPTEIVEEEACKRVLENGWYLDYVPKELRTEEMCKIAVQKLGYWGYGSGILSYVPEELRTEEMCKLAVQHDWHCLEYVPEKFKTEEICKIALEQNKDAFEYLPKEKNISKEIEKIEELEEMEEDLNFATETLEAINEMDLDVSKTVFAETEKLFKQIDEKMEELDSLKKLYQEMSLKSVDKGGKNNIKENVVIILEKFFQIFKELRERIEDQVNNLKEKFFIKQEQIVSESKIELNLSEEDKIKISSIKELPYSLLKYLAQSDNKKVLRRLAVNENLQEEEFIKLASVRDIKTKEILLENKNISTNTLDILVKDKDKLIREYAIYHKNLSEETTKQIIASKNIENIKILASKKICLDEIYQKYRNEKEIIINLAKNPNTPKRILKEISENNKYKDIEEIALRNENHPKNHVFKPAQKGDNDKLYQKLLNETSLRKNTIIKMFNDDLIYSDDKENIIINIKDSDNKVIGGYKLDIKTGEVSLLENSVEDEKFFKIANCVKESFIMKEELTNDYEMEI